MKRHRAAFLTFSILVMATLTLGAFAQESVIKIINRSDWDIHHLYLSPVDVTEWGPDQLGNEIIASGEIFTLYGIECDVYDIMIVDEDGDECVIEAEELCDDEAKWVLTNDELLGCQGWE